MKDAVEADKASKLRREKTDSSCLFWIGDLTSHSSSSSSFAVLYLECFVS